MRADWNILDDPEVHGVLDRAVRKVLGEAGNFGDLGNVDLSEDDLRSEAQIIVTTRYGGGEWEWHYKPDPYGYLRRCMENHLRDYIRPVKRHAFTRNGQLRQSSIEGMTESEGLDFEAHLPTESRGTESRLYDRQLVELLLPAVWDETYAWGMEQPHAPEHDMPKSASDPKKSNTLWAHLADIRSAWRRAPLTLKQRRALLMRYGLDWESKVMARHEGVSKSAISQRVEAAVGMVTDHLNGTEVHEANLDLLLEV